MKRDIADDDDDDGDGYVKRGSVSNALQLVCIRFRFILLFLSIIIS